MEHLLTMSGWKWPHTCEELHPVCFLYLKQTLGPNHVLVSFYMVSLFMNVPVDLACHIANNCLCADSTLNDCTSLSVDQVVTLLRFCLSATYLAYRGTFHQQTFATAVGFHFRCGSQPYDGGCGGESSIISIPQTSILVKVCG